MLLLVNEALLTVLDNHTYRLDDQLLEYLEIVAKMYTMYPENLSEQLKTNAFDQGGPNVFLSFLET